MKYLTPFMTMGLVLAAVGGAAGSEDMDGSEGRQWIDLAATEGPALYTEKCGMCHRENGMGTFILQRRMAPERVFLEDRDDLQPDFIRNAVRNGMGLMFPMSRGEVSDEQLDRIVDYLEE